MTLLTRRTIRLLQILTTLLTWTLFASATSTLRNPIRIVNRVEEASLDAPRHRISAYSKFDLSFTAFHRRIRLSLEPNHDILPPDAKVHYLDHDGNVRHSEPIDRMLHKVYKGDVWVQNLDRTFGKVGHARIVIHRDGLDPIFEGAFDIGKDHHHIQLSDNYIQTKHALDPTLDHHDGDHMVIFRDSDIDVDYRHGHDEFKKRSTFPADQQVAPSCSSDSLDFNVDFEHPVLSGIGPDTSPNMFSVPLTHLFGKRQMDTSTGAGNSAGVNLVQSIGQTNGCPSTRKIALIGVATDCNYRSQFKSDDDLKNNVIAQYNSATAVYEKTFNISLGLQSITISPPDCPNTPPSATPWNQGCSDSVDIQARLNLFSSWRGKQQDNNSHWTLLTTCKTGTAVGLAWLGQACVISADARNDTSGQTQTVSGANVVARTSTEWQVIAHETGHTFGAVHDCTSQTCSDGTSTKQLCCPLSSSSCDAGQKFIMNPSTAQGITDFSMCTIGNICSAIGRSSVKTSCFSSNKGVPLITGAQCGNGIVEEGEDCDCGGTASCGSNKCCNPTTCKFTANSVCDDSNEECCKGCQYASSQTVCRPSTGVCDPEEKCSGTNATCPSDQTAPDGQSCGKNLKCASGHCTSRNMQCQTLMGSYLNGNNDTYACDSQSCTLSCASPEFGPGMCYGLQQNFLDGTDCGGGGKCSNGQCKGSSFTKEIGSWISDHKSLVIGISAAVGAIVLLLLLNCAWRYSRRRKYGGAATGRRRNGSRARNGGMMPNWPGGNKRGSPQSSADGYGVGWKPGVMQQSRPTWRYR